MSDMITAEESQVKLDTIVGVTPDALPFVKDLLRTVIALHADAKAAQAMVVERACLAVSERAEWPEDEHGRTEQPALFARVINAIRAEAAADTDGLSLVRALRDSAEKAKADLRMVVSHATMGSTDGTGLSLNDICVKITALRNQIYIDAKAAQALVVERCMATIQAFSGSEEEADYKAYLANELRALADTDGLALVQALRAERDNLSDKLELERALTDGAHKRARTAEADRDRLAAANAALEAKLARLVGALEQIAALDDSAECCGNGVSDGYGPPECCGSPDYGLDRAQKTARATLAEVQARDEGANG